MTSEREKRSATTPPTSRKTTSGTLCARAPCRGRWESSMSSTAKASATGTIIEPVTEITRPA